MKLLKDNKVVLISLLVNLIIRVPRMLYAQGFDGFLAIWEAQLILNGNYFTNGTDFFDLLGYKSFSGYPIGSLLVIAFFLLITGRRVMFSILAFDFCFTILFTIAVYFLAQELEIGKKAKLYFIILLTSLPNILTFSYYTTTTRFPFIAIFPFVLLFLLKFNKTKQLKFLIFAFCLSLILNFFHRMALMLFPIILISLILLTIDKISKKDYINDFYEKDINKILKMDLTENENKNKNNLRKILNYLKNRFWILGLVIFVILGFVIFGTDLASTFSRSKFDIYCILTSIIPSDKLYLILQPSADQWIHYGLIFVIFLVAISFLIFSKNETLLNKLNKKSNNIRLIYYILPFVIVYPIIYSLYFICYIVVIVAAIFLEDIETKVNKYYLYSFCGLILGLFVFLYHFIVVNVLPYLIIGSFVLLLSVSTLIVISIPKLKTSITAKLGNKINRKSLFTISTLFLILLNSVFIVDRHSLFPSQNEIVTTQLSPGEIEISKFLKENGFGTFESFDLMISTRIAALTGWYFIRDGHNRGVFLLENKSIEEINCEVTPFLSWLSLKFFNCSSTIGSRMYYILMTNDCLSIEVLNLLKTYNIRYFISSSTTNETTIWENSFDSIFIKSLYEFNIPIVKSIENYLVWNTSVLY